MTTTPLREFLVERVVLGQTVKLHIRAVNGPAALRIANEQVARRVAAARGHKAA